MMGDVIPFRFNRGGADFEVRAVTRDGEPWFVLSDVCQVLGIANSGNAAARLEEHEKDTVRLADGIPGNPNMTVINESGLYRLVVRSDKPDAKAFQDWIVGEVLPSIRKTGSYGTPATVALTTLDMLTAIREMFAPLAIRFEGQDRTINRVEEKVDRLDEKVERIDQQLHRRRRVNLKQYEPTYIYVIWRFYGGKCPVSGVQLLEANGTALIPDVAETDHFYETDTKKITNGWTIAKEVNQGLGRGDIPRHTMEAHFRGFQEKLRVVMGNTQAVSPRLPKLTLFG